MDVSSKRHWRFLPLGESHAIYGMEGGLFFVTYVTVFIFIETFKLKQLIQCDSREENKI